MYILLFKCVIFVFYLAGEFGVVYKAELWRSDGHSETVAVKTLKGS